MTDANLTRVWVTVSGTDGEDEIRLQTRGTLRDEADGAWSLFYQETDPDSDETSETCVHWNDGQLVVVRPGDAMTALSFVQGETFVGEYPTPVGSLTLHLYPLEVRCRRRGHFGHIRLTYQMRLQSELSSPSEAFLRKLELRFSPCLER